MIRTTFLFLAALVPTLTLAAGEECARSSVIVSVGDAVLTVENNVHFVGYVVGEQINVELRFNSTCNVVFSGISLRQPNAFTPTKFVSGRLAGKATEPVDGTFGFVLQFDKLKQAGQKDFGTAHLNAAFGVDSDCDSATGDENGIDETATVGVQVFASTVKHP